MSIDACAEKTRLGDPDRFLSALTAPPELRGRLMVLYAFNLEIARAPFVSNEPLIGEMRLQFWADVIADMVAGKPPRAHEVAGPLAELVQSAELPCDVLARMVQARRFDVFKEAHETQEALVDYIAETAGNLMWMAALALGASEQCEAVVRQFALGCGIAALLQANRKLTDLGRLPLVDSSPAGISGLAQQGLQEIRLARRQRRVIPAQSCAALLAGWQVDGLLRLAHRNPDLVIRGQLELPEISRRGRLLFRTMSGRW
jgi:15-cis-phytoene synthase